MKKILVLFLLLLIPYFSFSEIISWKGMELGLDPYPEYLKKYVEKHDEKAVRKKFDVGKKKLLFYGTGTSSSLEEARTLAGFDCKKKILKSKKTGTSDGAVAAVNGLEFVYEYWEEDSESGYKVWQIYSCRTN